MARKLSTIIADIQQIEADGGDASKLRAGVEEAGYGERLPPMPTPEPQLDIPQPEEPGFLDNYGRIIAETGGGLVGGALGVPGGLPGMMLGAGLGGEGAGMAYDAIAGKPQRSPQELLYGFGLNTMGGPTAAAGKAPAAIAGRVGEGALFDLAPRIPGVTAGIDEAAEAVAERGGTTTPGQRGSGLSQRIEGALESSPFAGPIMDRNRTQTLNIFGDIIDDAVPQASSREVAGESAARGYDFNVARANARVDDAYRTRDDLLAVGGGRVGRVPAEALQDLSAEYKDLVTRDAEFAEIVFQDPDLMRSIQAIDNMIERGEAPTYDVLKRLRTMIGKKIDFNSPGSEQTGLKQLYDTLSTDLDEGAMAIGGEAARDAGRNADQMFRELQVQLRALDPAFKFAENPTQMYEALSRALVNKPDLARGAKQAMGENAWETFRDSWLRLNTRATKAGQDITGDLASPHVAASSLAHLKKQSPEGYKLLTEGREEALGVIDRLANMLREGERFVNRSRTGNTMNTSLFGGDLIGGTIGGLTGASTGAPLVAAGVGLIARPIISKLTAKALTSRTLNNALIKVGKAHDKLPIGPDLARALIAAGADKQEVQEIFGGPERPPLQGAGSDALY